MTDPAPLNSADYLIATLYAYMYNKDVSLQNDCVLWDNGLSLRRAEPYDYLEAIFLFLEASRMIRLSILQFFLCFRDSVVIFQLHILI